MINKTRTRTNPKDIVCALHLHFESLYLRNIAKALSRFVKKGHTAIRDWIQKYIPKRLFYRKTNVDEFIVDEHK